MKTSNEWLADPRWAGGQVGSVGGAAINKSFIAWKLIHSNVSTSKSAPEGEGSLGLTGVENKQETRYGLKIDVRSLDN